MKDFCITYNKSNKSLIKKLVSKLEADGITCMVSPRDFKQEDKNDLDKALTASKALLLIIDSHSAKNTDHINALEHALENDKPVIPFVTDKIDSDLYSEHFFYSFSWVDAYEESFEDACEILVDAYEDLSGTNVEQLKNRKRSKSKSAGAKLLENKPLVIAAAVIILLIISYFGYNYFRDESKSQMLVGEWNLVDYQDNVRRSREDSIRFLSTIADIKRNVLFSINDDNTFERRGFTPEPQIGKWSYDAGKSTLNLIPYGATAATNELKIRNITKTSFSIVAEEEITDSVKTANGSYRQVKNQSVTKIRFSRKK